VDLTSGLDIQPPRTPEDVATEDTVRDAGVDAPVRDLPAAFDAVVREDIAAVDVAVRVEVSPGDSPAAVDVTPDAGAADLGVLDASDAGASDSAVGFDRVAVDLGVADAPVDSGRDASSPVDTPRAMDAVVSPDVPADACGPSRPVDVPTISDAGLPAEGVEIARIVRGPGAGCGCGCASGDVCATDGTCASAPPSPRAMRPRSGTLTASRPLFQWVRRPSGFGTVEICRDPACAVVVMTLFGVDRARPSTDLPPGAYFYRVFGRDLRQGGVVDGIAPPVVYEFFVGRRRGTSDSFCGQIPDLNRDGEPDLVFADGSPPSPYYARIHVARRTGLVATLTGGARIDGRDDIAFARLLTNAGDVDGDGYPDIATLERSSGPLPYPILVYRGSRTSLGLRYVVTPPQPGPVVDIKGAGDVDGDGFADLVIVQWGSPTDPRISANVLYGGATGPSGRISRVDFPAGVSGYQTYADVLGLGDVDGDGFDDIGLRFGTAGTIRRLIVYRGGPAGLEVMPLSTVEDFDGSIAVGDLDGDGLNDVAGSFRVPFDPTMPTNSSGTHIAVLWGHRSGFSTARMSLVPRPYRVFPSAQACDYGCRFVGGQYIQEVLPTIYAGGDLDGDGNHEVLVSAKVSRGPVDDRWLYTVSVGSGRVLRVQENLVEVVTHDPANGFRYPYTSLAGVGDWNGDGIGDFASRTSVSSRVYRSTLRVYPGSPTGPSSPALLSLTAPQAAGAASSYGLYLLGVW